MARYQIIVAYDGTRFVGSQRQGVGRTVQAELEEALRRIGWKGTSILLAGRTDTGTHASGQVAAFDFDWTHGPQALLQALNTHLPADLAVRSVQMAAEDFHPRFDAVSRRYRYRLFCDPVRDPLRERYAWRVWPAVTDLTPLADLWPGCHDFSAFGTPPRAGGSTVRTVHAAAWRQNEDEWSFEIEADAFLYRMVRRLVFLQVAVGQGRLPPEALRRAVETSERVPLAGLAPACGLTLLAVRYDNLA